MVRKNKMVALGLKFIFKKLVTFFFIIILFINMLYNKKNFVKKITFVNNLFIKVIVYKNLFIH